jgi:NTP pyrophosphatase (non-canonical NTP hydrolase)
MDSNEYIKQAAVTMADPIEAINRIDTKAMNLLHAAFGMQTEAGEFTDMLKKSFFYGKELDIVNLKEELGDQLWYIALACETLDCTFEELFDTNIAKLRERFGGKFNEYDAEHRDLEAERKILEEN